MSRCLRLRGKVLGEGLAAESWRRLTANLPACWMDERQDRRVCKCMCVNENNNNNNNNNNNQQCVCVCSVVCESRTTVCVWVGVIVIDCAHDTPSTATMTRTGVETIAGGFRGSQGGPRDQTRRHTGGPARTAIRPSTCNAVCPAVHAVYSVSAVVSYR